MRTCIFCESSITHDKAKTIHENATYYPSVKNGDVIRAVNDGYERIVILDGNFDFTPSVWHKEILYAINKKCIVIGACSMGALRASELNEYGMIGYGNVYDYYARLGNEDDADVAILLNTANKVIPIVNIYFSLKGLLAEHRLQEVLMDCRNIFYKERTWEKLASYLSDETFMLLSDNYIDMKHQDALSVLKNLDQISNDAYGHNYFDNIETIYFKNLYIGTMYNYEFSYLSCVISERVSSLSISDNIQPDDYKEVSKLIGLDSNVVCQAFVDAGLTSITLTNVALNESIKDIRVKMNMLKGGDFKQLCVSLGLDLSVIEDTFEKYIILRQYYL